MTHLTERQEKCLIQCYKTGYIDLEVHKSIPEGLVSVVDTNKVDSTKSIQPSLKVKVSVVGQLLAQALMDRNKARELSGEAKAAS